MLNCIVRDKTIFDNETVLPLNWIVWNKTVLTSILILNWIVWNRTVFIFKNGFGMANLQWLICHKTKPTQYLEPFNFVD